MLGIGEAHTIGRKTMAEFGSLERAGEELHKLQHHWHEKLGSLIVETPDEDFNHTINVWGLYNALVSFNWSRSASLVYNGERDGLGFRDSVQDVLGVTAAIPKEARERLELMLTGQLSNGGAIPVIKPFDHHPGRKSRRSQKSTVRMTVCGSSMPCRPMLMRPGRWIFTARCCLMPMRVRRRCLAI